MKHKDNWCPFNLYSLNPIQSLLSYLGSGLNATLIGKRFVMCFAKFIIETYYLNNSLKATIACQNL